MFSLLPPALVASLIALAYAESHTVTFINNCGFGTPTLSVQGSVVSTGTDYTTNSQITGGLAYLDYDACGAGGGNCTGVELTLQNGISAADVTLISPYAFSVASCMSFYNGCDGTGFACTEPNCPGAYLTPTDSSATNLLCQANDVNLAVTFCDCSASSGSSGGGSTTTVTTTFPPATPTKSTTTPSATPSSTTTSTVGGAASQSPKSSATSSAVSSASSLISQTGTTSGSSSTTGSGGSSPASSQPSQSGSGTAASSPTASSSSTAVVGETDARDASNRSSNVGAIAGGVVGGVLGLLALLAAIFFCRRRRRRASQEPIMEEFEVLDPFPGGYSPHTRMVFGEKAQGGTSSTTLLRDAEVMDISRPPPPSSEATSHNVQSPPNPVASPTNHTRIIEDVVLRTLQGNNGEVPHASNAGTPRTSPPARSATGDPVDVSAIEGAVHRVLQGFLGGRDGDEPPPSYVR